MAAFDVRLNGRGVRISPRRPVTREQVLRPTAHFQVDTPFGPYPEINLSMGRILIPAGQPEEQEYHPYSRDEGRRLRAVYLGPERRSGDDPGYFDGLWGHFCESVAADHPGWPTQLPAASDDSRLRQRLEFLHYHAHGWFHLVEMRLLDLATRASARNGKHVIEIGSYQGRSTAVMAAALADCQVDSLVFSIDPNELSDQQADITVANVASVGQRRRLVQIQRPSEAVGHLFADEMAHLAFIDGSHEYDRVLADFHLCDRWLVPGGMLVFHDVYSAAHLGYEPPHLGPARVIDQVVLPSGRYEPLAGAHLTMALRKKEYKQGSGRSLNLQQTCRNEQLPD